MPWFRRKQARGGGATRRPLPRRARKPPQHGRGSRREAAPPPRQPRRQGRGRTRPRGREQAERSKPEGPKAKRRKKDGRARRRAGAASRSAVRSRGSRRRSSSRSTSARSASPCSRTAASSRSTSSGPDAGRSPATSTRASSTTSYPGMEAAFVDIGLEKNGFLFVDEIVGPELEGKRPRAAHPGLIQPRPGGARPGRQGPDEDEGGAADDGDLAAGPLRRLRPDGDGLGVSRRLEDDERDRLRRIFKEISPRRAGSSSARRPRALRRRIAGDLAFLMKLW